MSATIEPSPSINDNQSISPQEVVSQAIEACYSRLRAGVQVLVAKSGLVDGKDKIVDTGDEVLHDTVETALRSSDRFDSSRSAYSWLMGIAANKLREMRRDIQYETKRVQVFEDKDGEEKEAAEQRGTGDNAHATAEEQIDAVLYHTTNRSRLEDQDLPLIEMLALVNEGERHILTLSIVDGLSGADLAAVFGIREGAAYVRLARAQEHLRQKYLAIQGRKDQ